MKLCPQCNKKCLNSANMCDCGYSFEDAPSAPSSSNSSQASNLAVKSAYYVGGLLLYLSLCLVAGFAAGFGSRVGYFVGMVVGFIPLGVAKKDQQLLGMVGCFCCCVAGAIAGLIGAIPTAGIFCLVISHARKKSG